MTADGYAQAAGKLMSPRVVAYDVALNPAPRRGLDTRVTTALGGPLPRAVVAVYPETVTDIPQVAETDAKGIVRFPDVPSGILRIVVIAAGHPDGHAQVPAGRRGEIVLALPPR